MRKNLWILGVVAVSGAVALTGCGKKEEGKPLAIINGEAITSEMLLKQLEVKPTVIVQLEDGKIVPGRVVNFLGFQGFEDLIRRQLLMQMAKDEGVYPTDADLKKELEFKKALNPQFVSARTNQGIMLKQILDDIRVDLCMERIITKGVKVSDAEIEEFIVKNPKVFKEPPKADMLWILATTDGKKAEAEAALKSGQSFSSVSMRLSDAQDAKEKAGAFPNPNYTQLGAGIVKKIDATAVGQSTEWIKADEGWVKFMIRGKTPEKDIPKTKERLEALRRDMAKQRGAQAVDIQAALLKRLTDASTKIEVKEKLYQKTWEESLTNLKKQSK